LTLREGGTVVSCIIGVKSVLHHPSVVDRSIGGPEQRLAATHSEPQARERRRRGPEPDSDETAGQGERDTETVRENLRRERPGGHDKQRTGTRPARTADT